MLHISSYIPIFYSRSLTKEIKKLRKLTFEPTLLGPNRILRSAIHWNFLFFRDVATDSTKSLEQNDSFSD